MLDWLENVEQIAESVPESLSFLRSMLTENPKKRITASRSVGKLPATVSSERREYTYGDSPLGWHLGHSVRVRVHPLH